MEQPKKKSRGGSFRRIKALIIKEFHQIVRDPSSILLCVVMPLLLLFLYGYGVSLDMNHLRIGLVMEDTSPDAQSFAKSLTNSRYFDVTVSRKRSDFIDLITSGKLRGMVVIPSYFSEFRHRKDDKAPILVVADGSQPNTASFVQNYVKGAWQNWLVQQSISSDLKGITYVNVHSRFWFNEELESRNFLIPGSISLIMTLIGTLLTALVVSREWERGTMEALMSTPVSIRELLIGKLVPYFILGMISMFICWFVAVIIFGVPFRGSLLVLAGVSSLFLFTALMVGLLISTISRNQFVAAQASMIIAFLPGFMLSGFIFEISSMPFPIQLVSFLVPAKYFVSALQTLFLAGNVWPLIGYNVLFLIGFGFLIYKITARKTVKRLD